MKTDVGNICYCKIISEVTRNDLTLTFCLSCCWASANSLSLVCKTEMSERAFINSQRPLPDAWTVVPPLGTGDLHSLSPGLGEHTSNSVQVTKSHVNTSTKESTVPHLIPGLGPKSSYQITSVSLTLSISETSSGLLQQTQHLTNTWSRGWEVLQALLGIHNEVPRG